MPGRCSPTSRGVSKKPRSRGSDNWFVLCAFVFGTYTALCSCSPPEPGKPVREPSPLFPGFFSYKTLDETRAMLPPETTWKILWNGKSPTRARCPRFDEFTFAVRTVHLGFPGTLQISLFNDRLTSMIFRPDDHRAYFVELERRGGFPRGEGEQRRVDPGTVVWHSPRFTEYFIGWRDERIQEQINDWIRECS